MAQYYRFHSSIYDATRWVFLFGRARIVKDLKIRPGDTIIEIGCGTGHNFGRLQSRLKCNGRIVAVDCSPPMLAKAQARVRRHRWTNVEVIDLEYGSTPVIAGRADAVLFSYSLSMIPNWQQVLKCAKAELRSGGRVGVVDFCAVENQSIASYFNDWLRWNHVEADRPYDAVLTSTFDQSTFRKSSGLGGLWAYFRFTGTRP
jgi:S-adenosylmethionine-diacylgycerolhomoserine-N-methlytransferase